MARSLLYALVLAVMSSAALAATRTWNGSVNNNWSVPGNWNEGIAPVAGDDLVMPSSPVRFNMFNDIAADFPVRSVTFIDRGLPNSVVNGSSITLSAGINATNSMPWFQVPIRLTSPQTFALRSDVTFYAPVDLNSQTLTISAGWFSENGGVIGPGDVIVDNGATLAINEPVTFVGTITVAGTLRAFNTMTGPNLTFVPGSLLTGNGTVPDVPMVGGTINPGLGTLTTGSLSLQDSIVAVQISGSPQTGFGQLKVTGSVSLVNTSLQVSHTSGILGTGTSFVIIDNDGTDPIVGTFNGLPEGGLFTVDATQFRISYLGGTGNDVTITAISPAPKAWTGAVNNNWSTGANWNDGVPPSPGDDLTFPSSPVRPTAFNDMGANFNVGAIHFTSLTFPVTAITGQPFTIAGGITSVLYNWHEVDVPVTLSATQTFVLDIGSSSGDSRFNQPIDLNGHVLTIDGRTTITSLIGSGAFAVTSTSFVNLIGATTFTGTITSSGTLNVSGTIANSTLSSIGGKLTGSGAVPNTTIVNAVLWAGNESSTGVHGGGILTTGDLSMTGGSLRLNISSTTPGSGYNQINTVGSVTLDNPVLQVSIMSLALQPGESFVIINNDGSDPVLGTFSGLPEGAAVVFGSTYFRVSYTGGTGNDVTLTVSAPPAPVPASSGPVLILLACALAAVALLTMRAS